MTQLDGSYTQTRETTGHVSGKPRWVARLCGEVIGNGGGYASKRAAKSVCVTYMVRSQRQTDEEIANAVAFPFDQD